MNKRQIVGRIALLLWILAPFAVIAHALDDWGTFFRGLFVMGCFAAFVIGLMVLLAVAFDD